MAIQPSGVERTFDTSEILVSKTDTRGVITYANDLFLRVSAYREDEVLGQPHSLIRHPEMPRGMFQFMWDRLRAREEVFAYIANLSSDGAHYWVLAHVTPSVLSDGTVVGYHSSRRVPGAGAVDAVQPINRRMLQHEASDGGNSASGLARSVEILHASVAELGMSYEQFVFSFTEECMIHGS